MKSILTIFTISILLVSAFSGCTFSEMIGDTLNSIGTGSKRCEYNETYVFNQMTTVGNIGSNWNNHFSVRSDEITGISAKLSYSNELLINQLSLKLIAPDGSRFDAEDDGSGNQILEISADKLPNRATGEWDVNLRIDSPVALMTTYYIEITVHYFGVPPENTLKNTFKEYSGKPLDKKPWTFMFYDDADFTNGFDPLDTFKNETFSSENLNVIVLDDKEKEPASTWYIENHEKRKLVDNGEVNMGDYSTLFEFISFCKKNFPAERYMLWVYDHGMAWNGCCLDNTNRNDFLTMDEMQRALTDNGGIDVLCFSAPCLMGCIESAYELRDCVDVYVGSEETSGYIFWMGIAEYACNLLDSNPNVSNAEIGAGIIEEIAIQQLNVLNHYILSYTTLISCTISAIDAKKTSEVAKAIDAASIDLIEGIDTYMPLIMAHSLAVEQYNLGFGQIDLIDFAQSEYALCGMKENLNQVAQSTMDCVIAKYNAVQHARSNGLSIYFPVQAISSNETERIQYVQSYKNCFGLDFVADTHWDEFLEEYFSRVPQIVS